jgi:hypothetical protein
LTVGRSCGPVLPPAHCASGGRTFRSSPALVLVSAARRGRAGEFPQSQRDRDGRLRALTSTLSGRGVRLCASPGQGDRLATGVRRQRVTTRRPRSLAPHRASRACGTEATRADPSPAGYRVTETQSILRTLVLSVIAVSLWPCSVAGPPRIVCSWPSLSGPTHVRADVGVTPRFPPCEPSMSVSPPSADVPDVVRRPQTNQEHERDCDGS